MSIIDKIKAVNGSYKTTIKTYLGIDKRNPIIEIYKIKNDLDKIVENYSKIAEEYQDLGKELNSINIKDIVNAYKDTKSNNHVSEFVEHFRSK